MSALIVTGDDALFICEATKDGASFVVDPSATVKAALVSLDGERVLIDPVTCDVAHEQADWAVSSIVVVFPKSLTAGVDEYEDATIELQIDDAIVNTWFFPVYIKKGNIS